MAVNYANSLSDRIVFSGLAVTRKEGSLKKQLRDEVAFTFVNKKSNFDLRAFLQLRAFCVKNKVQFIHAHSSSFFWAVLLKFTIFRLRVIWHDHYGNRVNESNANLVLKIFSRFFFLVIAVNDELKKWSEEKLHAQKVIYLPNFSTYTIGNEADVSVLKGEEGKRIVFLANLKNPKNHLTFLKAYSKSEIFKHGWTLHLVGRDFQDTYSSDLKDYIRANQLENSVYIYGSREDIPGILKQSKVGVLCSTYEGFPVTLIEYGIFGLAVLSTDAGYCRHLIGADEGVLFDPTNIDAISIVLKQLLQEVRREEIFKFAHNFKMKVENVYTKEKILEKYLENITRHGN